MRRLTFNYNKDPLLYHIIFWICYFLVGMAIMVGLYSFKQALVRVSLGFVFHAFLIYVNLYWAIPQYFLQGRHLTHYAFLAALVLSTSYIRVKLDVWFLPMSGYIQVEPGSLAHYGGRILIETIVLSFSSSFRYMEDYIKRRELQQELRNYKLEAELKLLKTQVNPHFLFNTLNNIYSLSRTNAAETAPKILKLSEMMRYMLYESNEDKVPLDKEIQYLHNYIDLQHLKTENPQQISLEVEGDTSMVRIPPMLFLAFLENSFKHGDVHQSESGYVHGLIQVTDEKLTFSLENSIGKNQAKDSVGGIGLENVKQRLLLLYPEKHRLDIKAQGGVFTINLELNLS